MLAPTLLLMAASARAEESPLPAPDPYGLLQAWFTAWDQDEDPLLDPAGYGDPEDDPGAKIRRARVGFEGDDKGIRYGLIAGMSSGYDAVGGESDGGIELVDAYGGWRPMGGLWVVAGLQKVPVSREMLISADKLAFTDRSVASEWMVPGRDAGLIVDFKTREDRDDGAISTRVRAGAFNGNGSVLGDDDEGKLIAARAEVKSGKASVYQTWGAVDGLTFGVAGDFWLEGGPVTRTLGYGGDALVRFAGLAVLLEGHMSTIEPVDAPEDLPGVLATTPRMGLVGQVGYSAGAFEPVARFSLFDDDKEVEDNGDVADLTAGLTWHGKDDVVRAGAGYVARMEMGGTATKNDTARMWFQFGF